MDQYFIQELFKNKIEELRSKKVASSLREMAKIAGVHPAAFSEFLNGKRKFSKKMALKVSQNLDFSPLETKQIELFYGDTKNEDPSVKQKNFASLKMATEHYYLISDPLYYSVLCLVETKDFVNDNEIIAKRLKSTTEKVKSAKEKLESLGFIKENKAGELEIITANLASTDNIANSSLRTRHRVNCEDAKLSLSSEDLSQRYFAFETLSFKKEDLKVVQEKYNKLLDELIEISQQASKDEKDGVYEFCLNYFMRSSNRDKSF